MASGAKHPFIRLWALYITFLEKCLFRSFAHFLIGLFVFLEWSCVSLYILEIRPCLRYHWQIYFFIYSCSPFHSADVFFSREEAFYFDEVPFVYSFLYVPCSRGHISVKILLCGISEIFLPMLSSRTFMVSQLIFKPFIHLEFIFAYGVNWWITFIFFVCICPDLPTRFVEEAIFTPFYASSHFVKY